jgi:hypothetical protein
MEFPTVFFLPFREYWMCTYLLSGMENLSRETVHPLSCARVVDNQRIVSQMILMSGSIATSQWR